VLEDRRTDSLHATALLVDQNRCVPADAFAHFSDEIADLLRFRDIASEENEAPGAFGLVEDLFFGREGKATAAQDHCF
jgi:hypothetical protein